MEAPVREASIQFGAKPRREAPLRCAAVKPGEKPRRSSDDKSRREGGQMRS